MATKTTTNEVLLDQIENLKLSDGLFRLKDAMFSAPRIISVDRIRLAMESWKETEGDDIELRRARMFEKILEQSPLNAVAHNNLAAVLIAEKKFDRAIEELEEVLVSADESSAMGQRVVQTLDKIKESVQ